MTLDMLPDSAYARLAPSKDWAQSYKPAALAWLDVKDNSYCFGPYSLPEEYEKLRSPMLPKLYQV